MQIQNNFTEYLNHSASQQYDMWHFKSWQMTY